MVNPPPPSPSASYMIREDPTSSISAQSWHQPNPPPPPPIVWRGEVSEVEVKTCPFLYRKISRICVQLLVKKERTLQLLKPNCFQIFLTHSIISSYLCRSDPRKMIDCCLIFSKKSNFSHISVEVLLFLYIILGYSILLGQYFLPFFTSSICIYKRVYCVCSTSIAHISSLQYMWMQHLHGERCIYSIFHICVHMHIGEF